MKCPGNPPPTLECRPCDSQTLVSAQATHTEPKVLPYFEVIWTAPAEAVEVELYLVGNSVSGEGSATLDFWNFVEANPIVLGPAR